MQSLWKVIKDWIYHQCCGNQFYSSITEKCFLSKTNNGSENLVSLCVVFCNVLLLFRWKLLAWCWRVWYSISWNKMAKQNASIQSTIPLSARCRSLVRFVQQLQRSLQKDVLTKGCRLRVAECFIDKYNKSSVLLRCC